MCVCVCMYVCMYLHIYLHKFIYLDINSYIYTRYIFPKTFF